MAKLRTTFVCSNCGYSSPKWSGQCPGCREWNTMNEEVEEKTKVSAVSSVKSKTVFSSVSSVTEISTGDELRYNTGIGELDRVLGGGLVKGSVVLLSGDPGIGKSTLLMQACGTFSRDKTVLYVSGEESAKQLKLRAERLNVNSDKLFVMTETDVESICEYIKVNKPEVVMIDSIQTMNNAEIQSSPGSVTQVRECTNLLLRTGKSLDIPVIIVGHVNKDGAIAGPKVMEHIVDAVLYFEGERNYAYRILRAVKNRYGSTNEIGVFEMGDGGLSEVENPSQALLSERNVNVSGNCISCVMEGSRPILAEVQSLVCTSGYGNSRRMSTGFDFNRLSLILAVLEKRFGYRFSGMDTYLNIVGGLKLDEPAADLPVALALVSGFTDKPVPDDVVAIGEIGLSGEVRSVSRISARISEAARLGFTKCIVPRSCLKQIKTKADIEVIGVRNLHETIANVF
ncbi:MAG: DNA repair protein RadA [Clostridia bacterium]|nr:DNA repair protein RadA [Clostridia bacterium]MBO5913091.1 DNA repair protein RadA [Clostridia bacterium]